MAFFVVRAMKGTFCLFIPRTESEPIVSLVLDLICPASSACFRSISNALSWLVVGPQKGDFPEKGKERTLCVYLHVNTTQMCHSK